MGLSQNSSRRFALKDCKVCIYTYTQNIFTFSAWFPLLVRVWKSPWWLQYNTGSLNTQQQHQVHNRPLKHMSQKDAASWPPKGASNTTQHQPPRHPSRNLPLSSPTLPRAMKVHYRSNIWLQHFCIICSHSLTRRTSGFPCLRFLPSCLLWLAEAIEQMMRIHSSCHLGPNVSPPWQAWSHIRTTFAGPIKPHHHRPPGASTPQSNQPGSTQPLLPDLAARKRLSDWVRPFDTFMQEGHDMHERTRIQSTRACRGGGGRSLVMCICVRFGGGKRWLLFLEAGTAVGTCGCSCGVLDLLSRQGNFFCSSWVVGGCRFKFLFCFLPA